MINHNPDKSQSTCEDKYIKYQAGRGVIIPLQTSPHELPVPEPLALEPPVPEPLAQEVAVPELPVPEPPREHINIIINNVFNSINNVLNIGVANPSFQDIVSDEDDIQRQILLAMELEDDFSHLY